MRFKSMACTFATLLLGCGLENAVGNAGHNEYDRPASKVTGAAAAAMVTDITQVSILDGQGNLVAPFLSSLTGTDYELRLPSSKYSMLRVRVDVGNLELRSILPSIGEESAVSGVDVDARNMTETLIAEARLSADGDSFAKVTPEAYLGFRALVRAGLDAPGPTQDLLTMVQRLMTDRFDPTLSVMQPDFFNVPTYCRLAADETCTATPITGDYVVKQSALDRNFLARNPYDYVGDGTIRNDSHDFDVKLAEVAQTPLYRPAGCPDPAKIRVLFTVDFNEGGKNGNCGTINRFSWAKDKPGKSMFFVGWIYTAAGIAASEVDDPALATAMGSATPNVVAMYDDGTNGDETAGDNIWSIYFDMPRSSPGHILRIGYKYTWGTSGALWTGSEEWPGNSRILEVEDDNGDNFVYRRDTFGDEATNKDKSNLNLHGTGSIDWPTDLHGCGPESHENRYNNKTCSCDAALSTPRWIGARTGTCMQ